MLLWASKFPAAKIECTLLPNGQVNIYGGNIYSAGVGTLPFSASIFTAKKKPEKASTNPEEVLKRNGSKLTCPTYRASCQSLLITSPPRSGAAN